MAAELTTEISAPCQNSGALDGGAGPVLHTVPASEPRPTLDELVVAFREAVDGYRAMALKTHGMDLEKMLTAEECAKWMGISKNHLMAQVHLGVIPAFPINAEATRFRFHPKTILEHGHSQYPNKRKPK